MTTPGQNPLRWQDEQPMQGVFLNPGDQDGLTLLDMPAGLRRKTSPALRGDSIISDTVKRFAAAILTGLRKVTPSEDGIVFDCAGLDRDDHRVLDDLLGDGEVSIVAGSTQIVESTLTGVWRVIAHNDDGDVISDTVEVGAIPRIVRQINLAGAAQPAPLPDPLPDGVMNAPPVLAETAGKAREWTPGTENHVINFTLMPMSPADGSLIAQCLGQAPLVIVSQGYGACRVLSTAVRHVWAVQYFNSTGKIILDTLEVGDVPSAALAAKEDFEDSARRLAEIIEAYLS